MISSELSATKRERLREFLLRLEPSKREVAIIDAWWLNLLEQVEQAAPAFGLVRMFQHYLESEDRLAAWKDILGEQP